jgi:geranylgeranyl pyrophosphate synthase
MMAASTAFDVKKHFAETLPKVEAALAESMDVLPREWAYDSKATTVHESMRYSLMAGGKRIRPLVTLAACKMVGGTEAKKLSASADSRAAGSPAEARAVRSAASVPAATCAKYEYAQHLRPSVSGASMRSPAARGIS